MPGIRKTTEQTVSSELKGSSMPLDTAILDASGNQIVSFGGTQYTEGDTDTTITGTATLGEAPSNTLKALQLDAASNLLVAAVKQVGAGNVAMGQVSVDATSTGVEIVAARATRRTVTIVNNGTTQVFLKGGSVASTTGVLLAGTVGASATFESVSQIKGITASGTVTVSYVEEYD